MIRITIADDHQLFVQGLRTLFVPASNIDIVAVAQTGQQAIEQALHHKPDVAIIDLSMPDISGLDVVKTILKKAPATRVVVLTMHTNPALGDRAIAIGVKGYVLKDDCFDALVNTVVRVHAGKTCISPSITDAIQQYKTQCPDNNLTTREEQVLTLIANGMSNRDIADTLFISPKTVDKHRTALMRKLNVNKVTDLVRHALQTGLVF